MAIACFFRESCHLLLGASGSCSRRPAGDAGARKSSDACIALPTCTRLQHSCARISETAAAPAVDLRSQSLVLRHILYIRAEEIARVRSGARGIRRVRRAGVLGSQDRRRPICGDARSCSSLRPRTRRFSTWAMGRNAETAVAKYIALAGTSPIWQRGFFDHVLHNDESYGDKWNYVRENPVRAGFVNDPDEWRYSGEIVVIDRA